MGYEMHVVRTDHWLKSADSPVLRAEVDKVVQSDPELSWSASDTVGGRFDFIEWKGDSIFYWDQHEIVGKSLLEPQVLKLCEIAEKLGAKVIGDDGEEYKVKRSLWGRKKLTYTAS